MKFKDIYYVKEALILGARNRVILKKPTVIPMPKSLEGFRLETVVNNDNIYFTYMFKNKSLRPESVAVGSWEDPMKYDIQGQNEAKEHYEQYFIPYEVAQKQGKLGYGGEVYIRPPFDGYVDHPQDKTNLYFDDFENPDAVYQSGKTILDPLVKLSKEEIENMNKEKDED